MNPHFRKGNKAKHGSGHLWVLADIDEEDDLTITKVKSLSTDTGCLITDMFKVNPFFEGK